MRLGVVADIHGNLAALDAIVEDASSQRIDRWWALGDLVMFGPRPVEVLETLRSLDAACLRGNTDRYVVTGDQPPAHRTAADAAGDPALVERYAAMAAVGAWTRGALTERGWVDWLADLPLRQRIDRPDGSRVRVLGVHASPVSDDGVGIDTKLADDALAELLAGCDADVVIGGHTHVPTDRTVGEVRALNPGSAGLPKQWSGGANWMIVEAGDAGASGAGVTVEHRAVPFDVDAAVADAHRRRHPNTPFFEAIVRGTHPFAR